MIFLSHFYAATKLPLSLARVTDMMRKADNTLLVHDSDLKKFAAMLVDVLNEDRRPMITAYIGLHFSNDGKSGALQVYKKEHTEDACVRLYFQTVESVLEYDSEAGDMFDISDRFAELAEEGGVL